MNPLLLPLVEIVLQALTSKEAQDAILDLLEDLVQNTNTLVDDKALLPMIQAYRKYADIPDDD